VRVYLDKDRKCVTNIQTVTHATVTGLTSRIENVEHKLYIYNLFSSPDLFDNLHSETMNCCGTVRPN
jgi:hypothetical protein